MRQGRQNVIRFEVFFGEGDHPHCCQSLLQQRHLPDEFLWSVSPGRLVLRVNTRPERKPGEVKGHRNMGGILFLEEPQKHRDKPMDRIRVLALWGDKTLHGEGVKSPERQRMTVNNHQGRLVTHSASLQACADAKERP